MNWSTFGDNFLLNQPSLYRASRILVAGLAFGFLSLIVAGAAFR